MRIIRYSPLIFLAGCTSANFYKEPAIVDISDSKVVVQREHSNLPGNIFASPNTASMQDVAKVAKKGCEQYREKKATLLSETCGRAVYTQYSGNVCAATNYLFSCSDR